MRKKAKKFWFVLIIVLATLCLITSSFGIYFLTLFKDELNALGSYKTLEDSLFYFEYDGDYGLKKLIKNGGVKSDAELAGYLSEFLSKGFYKYEVEEESYACSTVSAETSDGDKVFGRNFDWENCQTCIIKTVPEDGYVSFCTANLDFLGFGDDFTPDGTMNQMMSLAAIYVPLDGMNEKGLCIADLIIRVDERINQNSNKCDVTTTTAIRQILDYCATVDEALELLKNSDMHSSADMMHHFSISDASGKSVVVEYVNNEMVVSETAVVTNFYITEAAPDRAKTENNVWRFDTLKNTLDAANGIMSVADIKAALTSVWDDTQWSIVYNQTDLTIDFYFRQNGEKAYSYSFN